MFLHFRGKKILIEKEALQQQRLHELIHDLRAPLVAIKDSAILLSKPDEPTLNGEQKNRLLLLIAQESKKMLDKVGLILDTAKLSQGKLVIQKHPTDMKKIINEKLAFYIPEAHQKLITLTADIKEPLPLVMCDEGYISEAIDNLLSNALKFTPANGKITIHAAFLDQKMVVSVVDTGTGIPKEKQDQIFSKFSQIAPGSTPVKGTGLGLYIVKGIIEAHAGTITFTSEPGTGTTVSFSLPGTVIETPVPAVQKSV